MRQTNQYTDAILYFPSYSAFLTLAQENHPEIVSEEGEINAFSRTPAVMNGDALLVYVRMTEEQIESFNTLATDPSVEILSQASYNKNKKDTPDVIFNDIFNTPEKLDKYKSVYDFTPYEVPEEESGETHQTVTPPERFGKLAS